MKKGVLSSVIVLLVTVLFLSTGCYTIPIDNETYTQSEINALQDQINLLSKQLNFTQQQLETTRQELRDTQQRLVEAQNRINQIQDTALYSSTDSCCTIDSTTAVSQTAPVYVGPTCYDYYYPWICPPYPCPYPPYPPYPPPPPPPNTNQQYPDLYVGFYYSDLNPIY
jgi:TolA-binding protein